MTQVRAVLFDMDGILVDSEPVWYAVEHALVERLGGQWSKDHQRRCIGGTIDATCAYIADVTGTDRPGDELRAELLAAMVGRFDARLPLVPGAVALVDGVRQRGVATALVSSSYRVLVDAALRSLGSHRFDVTVAGDEVTAGKPDPEPYLRAAAQLGVDPASCVVVEDAVSGVRAAEAAGCCVVAVPSVAPIPAAPARWVVSAVADIDPDWLLTRWRSPSGHPSEPPAAPATRPL